MQPQLAPACWAYGAGFSTTAQQAIGFGSLQLGLTRFHPVQSTRHEGCGKNDGSACPTHSDDVLEQPPEH